jgi:hypothetical protein
VPTVSALVSATDAQGDASASQENGLSGEAYQDIVSAAVDGEGGTFAFAMVLWDGTAFAGMLIDRRPLLPSESRLDGARGVGRGTWQPRLRSPALLGNPSLLYGVGARGAGADRRLRPL